MRIGEALGVDRATLADTFHACLLLYVGCTADVHVRAQVFDDIELASQNLFPVMFGSQRELLGALARSIAPAHAPLGRAAAIARGIPRAVRVLPVVDVACREVAGMLSDRLGLPHPFRRSRRRSTSAGTATASRERSAVPSSPFPSGSRTSHATATCSCRSVVSTGPTEPMICSISTPPARPGTSCWPASRRPW